MYKIYELKELLKNKKMSEKFSGIYGGDKNSIEEITSKLGMTQEQVIEALNEMIAVV